MKNNIFYIFGLILIINCFKGSHYQRQEKLFSSRRVILNENIITFSNIQLGELSNEHLSYNVYKLYNKKFLFTGIVELEDKVKNKYPYIPLYVCKEKSIYKKDEYIIVDTIFAENNGYFEYISKSFDIYLLILHDKKKGTMSGYRYSEK